MKEKIIIKEKEAIKIVNTIEKEKKVSINDLVRLFKKLTIRKPNVPKRHPKSEINNDVIKFSIKNWSVISELFAPMALRIPISFTLSFNKKK